eukprot:15895-Eustigmatos_ZCMA.PRE.1
MWSNWGWKEDKPILGTEPVPARLPSARTRVHVAAITTGHVDRLHCACSDYNPKSVLLNMARLFGALPA